MRKLRLPIVLPIIQFVVAAILLQLGDRAPDYYYGSIAQRICWAVNAPAVVVASPAYYVEWRALPFNWAARPILGFYFGDLFLLVGVIALWCFVGRALDRRWEPQTSGWRGIEVAWSKRAIALALGCLSFLMGLSDLYDRKDGYLDYVPGPLELLWSISLIFVSVRGIVRAIHYRGAT